jgi:hypothetical protein
MDTQIPIWFGLIVLAITLAIACPIAWEVGRREDVSADERDRRREAEANGEWYRAAYEAEVARGSRLDALLAQYVARKRGAHTVATAADFGMEVAAEQRRTP